MLRKICAIVIACSILFSSLCHVYAETDPNLPLSVRIDKEYANLKNQNEEYVKLRKNYFNFNNVIAEIGKIKKDLAYKATGEAAFFAIKLVKSYLDSLVTNSYEVGQLLMEYLLNTEEWYQIKTDEQHGKTYVQYVLAIRAMDKVQAFAENERNKVSNQLNEVNSKINATKQEILRLKALYKNAMGCEYISNIDNAYNSAVDSIISKYSNLSSASSNPNAYDTAYGAANAMYQNRVSHLEDYQSLSQPELIWKGNDENELAFRMYLTNRQWDEDFKTITSHNIENGPREIWEFISKTPEGKYVWRDSELIAPPVPKITTNSNEVDFERGKQVTLKADVECFDGFSPRKIIWYVSNGLNGEVRKIGTGSEITWDIPEDCPASTLYVAAEDDLYNVALEHAGYLKGDWDYYIPRSEEQEQQSDINLPEHNELIMLRLNLEFAQPCEVSIDWSEKSGFNADYTKVPAYFSEKTKNGNYIYKCEYYLVTNGFDENGKPIEEQHIYYRINAKTGNIKRVGGSERVFKIRLGQKHIELYNEEQKKDKETLARELSLQYKGLLGKYKAEYEVISKMPTVNLENALHKLNVRTKSYIDWRSGKANADNAWGINYTVELLDSDSKECIETLKQFAQVSGCAFKFEDNGSDSFDVKIMKRLAAVDMYFENIKAWIAREDALSKLYEELVKLKYKLEPYVKDGITEAVEEPVQYTYGTSQENINDAKELLEQNILQYPIEIELKDKIKSELSDLLNYTGNSNNNSQNSLIFTDVPKNTWYSEAVYELAKRGIIVGVGNSQFMPEDIVTRAQFATAVVKLLQLQTKEASGYTDVGAGSWYSKYIGAVVENGIMKGYNSIEFKPEDTITREQASVILVRIYKLKTQSEFVDRKYEIFFKDKNEISDWALEYVKDVYNLGIMRGKSENLFDPKGYVTRAEMAVMLNNITRG